MKKNKLKKLSIFALTTALTVSCLAGCGKKKEEDTEQATITTEAAATMSDADIEFAPTKEGYVINEFSGEWIDESLSNQRPLCIMINNIVDAMPQSGISQADITYEMLVEGGITRYMCVFKDYSNLEKLGPVRSARHYYVQMANMLGGIYAHVGWSVYAESWIMDTGLNNLNGLYDSTTFYRDESRVAPHNCYTNSEKLKEGIAAAGYSTEYLGEKSKAFAFNVEDTALGSGQTANKVTTAYNDSSTRWYEYNADEKLYYRFQYGNKQIDQLTGEQIAYKNIILQYSSWRKYDEHGYLNIDVDEPNVGKYIVNGKAIDITWKKHTPWGATFYYDTNGNQITMDTGKTWVCIIQDTYADRVEILGSDDSSASSTDTQDSEAQAAAEEAAASDTEY